MPRHTTEETELSVNVTARISKPEKEALDKSIAMRGAMLRAQGITGQDTFSAWLRAVIREKTSAEGYPVVDAPVSLAPVQKDAKTKKLARAKRPA